MGRAGLARLVNRHRVCVLRLTRAPRWFKLSPTMKIKPSDVTFHGTPKPHQMSVFTCYGLGLGRFLTDLRGLPAVNAARAYFRAEAKKRA